MGPQGTVVLAGSTVWGGSPPRPAPGWLLVRGGHVMAMGVGAPTERADRTVDLHGHHVLPSFSDPHSHLSVGAWFPMLLDGAAWRGPADAVRAVRAAATSTPPDGWIVATRVDHDLWQEPRPPTRVELDDAGGGRPVLLVDMSLHRGALSTEAFRRCRVSPAHDPHGDVDTSRRGRPTGLVWERAFGRALYAALRGLAEEGARPGLDDLLEAEAGRHLRHGITRVHEPGVPPEVHDALGRLAARTPLRLSWSASAAPGLLEPAAVEELPDAGYGQGVPSVKLFLDGAQRCAVRLPVTDVARASATAVSAAARERGLAPLRTLLSAPVRPAGGGVETRWRRFDDREVRGLVSGYATAGFRVRLHALGNGAVRQAAAVVADVRPSAPVIEHAMLLRPPELDALAACGATVSIQPGFLTHDGARIAAHPIARGLRVLPLASLRTAGVHFAISSDHPCGPLDPLHNLRRAVDRQLPDGRAFQPDESLSRSAALEAATAAAAAAAGAPGEGILRVGAPADLAIVDRDPFEPGARVVQTWVAGVPVWDAGATS